MFEIAKDQFNLEVCMTGSLLFFQKLSEVLITIIVLNNHLATCGALPIHQTTRNIEEMADIDGLWNWNDFASEIFEGAIVGAVAGGITGVGIGVGVVGGAIAGACTYAFEKMITGD